jgi:hypothetical protein
LLLIGEDRLNRHSFANDVLRKGRITTAACSYAETGPAAPQLLLMMQLYLCPPPCPPIEPDLDTLLWDIPLCLDESGHLLRR